MIDHLTLFHQDFLGFASNCRRNRHLELHGPDSDFTPVGNEDFLKQITPPRIAGNRIKIGGAEVNTVKRVFFERKGCILNEV